MNREAAGPPRAAGAPAGASATAVTIDGLGKTFPGRRAHVALDNLSLAVEPGELFVILGPSGCGKSTLLNLVAGLERATVGRIAFGGHVVADAARRFHLPPFERDVAMVFQSYALYPHLSVAGNLAFPLTNLRPRPTRAKIDERIRRAAALLQIEELLERRPSELSGGQRQRVAIGRAVVREPAVFLLDEPLSNLDARLRLETRTQLKALQRRLDVTTLYVTHDQVEAMTLGDRIAVLRDGRLEQVGPPAEIYDRPASPFVARFVGSPPMNLITGTIETGPGSDAPVFRAGRLTLRLPPPAPPAPAGEILLGIRPEHLALVPPGEGDGDVTITLVEDLGGERLAYAQDAGATLVIRTHGEVRGGPAGVRIAPGKIRFFSS